MSKITEVKDRLQDALTEARQIVDAAEKGKRDFDSDERKKINALLKTARTAKKEYSELAGDAAMKQAIEDLGAGIGLAPERPTQQSQKAASGELLSEKVMNSAAWQGWMKQAAPNGRIPEGARGISSPPVEVKGLLKSLFRKTLLTGEGATSAGAFVESERTGIYEPLGRFPLRVRDLISVRTTTSDTVEFVRQTAQVTQAAPVEEANVTTYTGATGEISGQKPEGTMTFERVTQTVKTVAVWVPATKRALSDAGQLRGIIDDELRADLDEELENQMLTGDGTGENFTGLANTANTLAQAFVTDIAVTSRKAITYLAVTGKQIPTGWLLNPQDWEAFDLLTDDQGRYYWGGPMAMGPRTLWGAAVAQSYLQTQGTGLLANWGKAVLWDREMATVTATDSHADFFIRNMVAILAEARAAFGVIRPTAFVEVDLTAGS